MEENDRKDNNKDPFADGSPSEEDVKRERGPRISYIVAGICALLVAAAAGAAIVADKAFRKEESARIYSSSSAVGAKDSSVSEDSSDASAASKGKSDSSASESRSESKSEKKKTATTTTAVVYEYPQDINKAELECFLAVSGINKTVAEGIVSYRERKGAIHNFEELLEIYGIGERTLTVIEEHFFISSDDSIAYTTVSQTTRKPAETEKKTSAPEKTTTVPTVTEPPKVTSAESEAEPADSSEAEAVICGSDLFSAHF